MIHSVYFWLKEDLSEEQKAFFKEELLLLRGIEYLNSISFGQPASTPQREGVTEHSFDYSLVIEFASREDHDRYQGPDEVHARFVSGAAPLCRKILVLDSESFQ